MAVRALTWNLFHGRDFPPDPALRTWRSRLLGITERNETHNQVNRDLYDDFAGGLAGADWDIALLQETPPRWHRELAAACGADAHRVLTARNSFGALRSLLARQNPDLIASNEGGTNLTLVRRSAGSIRERREFELRRSRWTVERRTMAFTRVALPGAGELCIANMHLSAGRARQALAEEELRLAAERAVEWSGETPLIFGGDLNLRPAETSAFGELEERLGITGARGPNALDHLLARGVGVVERPAMWPAQRREIQVGRLAMRLSDHAPVVAVFAD